MTKAIRTAVGLALGASLLLAGGCAKRKLKYDAPVSAPLGQAKQWSTTSAKVTAKPADDKTLSNWWSTLNDPVLTSLEERAVKANLDLRSAEAKVRQAQAQRNIAKAGLLPTVTADGSATGTRSSSRAGSGSFGQSYSAGVTASWEPDFYNKLHGQIAIYEADLQSAQESLRDVLVSLTAEVALDYVDIRNYQEQLAVTRDNLKSQRETYDLTVARFDSGLVTQLDVVQARQTVESTEASIPALETSLQQSINALALLLGERPGVLDAEMKKVAPVPGVPAEVAIGVPADLLRRRPDIRAAERDVAAQSAQVGVTEADLYPSFTLSGALNLSSLSLVNLFTPAALAGNAAGGVTHTIFSRGKIREQVKVQNALLDQKIVTYESTVLTALKDVENALVAFGQEQERHKSLKAAAGSAGQALAMSRELYSAGLKTFLDVLESQRTLLSAQNALAQSNANITTDLVRLYKALGGGWN